MIIKTENLTHIYGEGTPFEKVALDNVNVSIKKGVKTPNYTTVAANSVLLKDYSKDIEPFSILAGNPAKIIATGYSRVWKDEKEKIKYLNHYFSTHPDDFFYELSKNEQIEDYTF